MLPCCPPAKKPASPWWILSHTAAFVVWWQDLAEWMNSSVLGSFSLCVKHFHRHCTRCVILDQTSVLNQGSHAQNCRAAFLSEETIHSLGSCGSEQNALRWKHQLLCLKDEEHGSWLCAAGYKGSLSHLLILDVKCLLFLTTEVVAAATWPLLWGAFNLFLLFRHLRIFFLIV